MPYKGWLWLSRKTIGGFNSAAKGTPFLVLTDLDRYPCPVALIQEWLTVPKHHNLLFRVAVREVESWLLADSTGFAKFLGIREPLTHPDYCDFAPRNADLRAENTYLGEVYQC